MLRLRSAKEREGGFTLVELMIVVAIIGILAAIAIPNFIRFQLRSRAGEGKVNLAAVRVAEESYFAEYQTFLPVAVVPSVAGAPGDAANCAAAPGRCKQVWSDAFGAAVANTQCAPPITTGSPGHCRIGWMPDGPTYYNYEVVTNALNTAFFTAGESDIDADGTLNYWGFDKSPTGQIGVGSGVVDTMGCTVAPGTGGGPMDLAANPPVVKTDLVAPCGLGFSNTVF